MADREERLIFGLILSIWAFIILVIVAYKVSQVNNMDITKIVAALIATIGVAWTIKSTREDSKQRNITEFIANNRIEWMRLLREFYGDYIKRIYLEIIIENTIKSTLEMLALQPHGDSINELKERLNQYINKKRENNGDINKYASNIRMQLNIVGVIDVKIEELMEKIFYQLGELNKKNMNLNRMVIKNEKFNVGDLEKNTEEFKEHCRDVSKLISSLEKLLRVYLKIEWEKSKQEVKGVSKFEFISFVESQIEKDLGINLSDLQKEYEGYFGLQKYLLRSDTMSSFKEFKVAPERTLLLDINSIVALEHVGASIIIYLKSGHDIKVSKDFLDYDLYEELKELC